jgi:hypothetical protein
MEIICDQLVILKNLRENFLKLCTFETETEKNIKETLIDLGTKKDAVIKGMKDKIQNCKDLSRIISQMDFENRTDIDNLTKSILYENITKDSGLEMDVLLILPLSREVIGNSFTS